MQMLLNKIYLKKTRRSSEHLKIRQQSLAGLAPTVAAQDATTKEAQD